jgi:hypothetical protein
MDVDCSVPGSAAGQFVALEKDDLAPAVFGQVVEDGAADDAASDNDGLCMVRMKSVPSHFILCDRHGAAAAPAYGSRLPICARRFTT